MPYPAEHQEGILNSQSRVIQVEIQPELQRNHHFKQEMIFKYACWLSFQKDLALSNLDPARSQGLDPCQCQHSGDGQ